MGPRELIESAVRAWQGGEPRAFWNLLADDVHYEVIGTTPVSGVHPGRRAFIDEALIPMGALLTVGSSPLEYDLICEGQRVVFMWSGRGVMLNGDPYHQTYCWVLEITGDRITKVKAYLDTALVEALFNQS